MSLPRPLPPVLLIVDVQQGFITPPSAHVPATAARLQKIFAQAGAQVIASRFINRADSIFDRALNMRGRFRPNAHDTALAFDADPDTEIVVKYGYSTLNDAFFQKFRKNSVNSAAICGIATENCVLKAAVDFFEAGIRPVVIEKACASHESSEYHHWGLSLIERFIGPDQIWRDELD